MHEFPRRTIVFAMLLSLLAGMVDAVGFLGLSGYFVSFMSGNSTRLGIGLGTRNVESALIAFGIIGSFVIGVAVGATVGYHAGNRRRKWVLSLVAGLLAASGFIHFAGLLGAAMMFQVMAMGALNAVFEKDGDVAVGVTYMTGTLVRVGKRIALALRGGERWSWVPYAALWFGLVLGAAIGGATYRLGAGVLMLICSFIFVLLALSADYFA